MNRKEITIDGVTHNLNGWCEIYKINRSTVYDRVKKRGMTWEEAIKAGRMSPQKETVQNRDRRLCMKCKWHSTIGSNYPADVVCDYIGYHNRRRPCPAKNCTEFVKGKPARQMKSDPFAGGMKKGKGML